MAVGFAFIVIEYEGVDPAQPLVETMLATKEPAPADPHVTVTEVVPCPEVIVPPVATQVYVEIDPVTLPKEYVLAEFAQTDCDPAIIADGAGFIVILIGVEGGAQPTLSITLIDAKFVAAPHVTVTEAPFATPIIVPPLAIHL